jgi:hypothetical protein
MKRGLYFCALLCLLGFAVCVDHLHNMPNLVSEAIEAVQSHDASAREDVEAAREPNPEGDALLRDAGLFLLGVGVFVMLARRSR